MYRPMRVPLWCFIFFILTGIFFMPCWSISYGELYYFEDKFDDATYTDKWTAPVAGFGYAKVTGSLLDVHLTAVPGSCSSMTISQKNSFNFTSSRLRATVVLRPAPGMSAGVRIKRDSNNYSEMVIGPDAAVVTTVESGKGSSQVLGSADAYLGKDTIVAISLRNYSTESTSYITVNFMINGVTVAEVPNLGVGTKGLHLELLNSYCPVASGSGDIYYDSVAISEALYLLGGRMTGKVVDLATGQGIALAWVETESSGGGLTSPNGNYILGLGDEKTVSTLVSARGYSPEADTVTVDTTSLLTIRNWALKRNCASAISPESVVFGSAGGSGSISLAMTQQAGCGMYWLPESSGVWISLPGGSGIVSGSGSLSYLVASNSGASPRTGTISLAGQTFRVIQRGTQKMAVPSTAQAWEHGPVAEPLMEVLTSSTRPFAAGNLTGGVLDMGVGLPEFAGPVDIYLGFKMPDYVSPEIWVIGPDLNVAPATQGVPAWRTGVTGPLYDDLYGEVSLSLLPPGLYYLYTLVTPAGRMDSYYLWTTHFTAP